jgi:hypothetical protein
MATASGKEEAKAVETAKVDPSNPTIAPTGNPSAGWKDDYYKNRGFTVAPKDWTEWSDLPAPYKYFSVKVDPAHVQETGFLYRLMSDWKTAVPAALLVAMPFYSSGKFPSFDERMELAVIIITAGVIMFKEVGPMFVKMQTAAIEAKNASLYAEEKAFNEEIAHSIEVMQAGLSIPETVKTVNTAERALRAIEAQAATRKAAQARADAVTHALEYLVQLKSSAGAETEGAALRTARAVVESTLEKDAATQQKSIEAAIKALKDGSASPADDIVEPLLVKSIEAAKKELLSKATASPFTNPQQVEMFKKRFGFDLVSKGGKILVVKEAAQH